MIAAIGGHDLVATGVQAGHSHGVFHRLGATGGEEDFARSFEGVVENQLGRPRAYEVAVLGSNGAQDAGLFLDCGDDRGVLVANVGVDQL